ncbi:MAG: hypothetical protein ACLU99_03575 [Alphaproteobacteria bacterium]
MLVAVGDLRLESKSVRKAIRYCLYSKGASGYAGVTMGSTSSLRL